MIGNYYHLTALSLKAFHGAFLVLGIIMLFSFFVFQRLKPGDGEAMLQPLNR